MSGERALSEYAGLLWKTAPHLTMKFQAVYSLSVPAVETPRSQLALAVQHVSISAQLSPEWWAELYAVLQLEWCPVKT
jgi:hypothetical protein